jgi:hypothetical protein
MNIVFVNLLPIVFFSLFDGYIMPIVLGGHTGIASPYILFVLSLISVLPLVYYVGMGVACVSAQVRARRGGASLVSTEAHHGRGGKQSSFAIAAVVNATFGSIVEIVLYVMAVIANKGERRPTPPPRAGPRAHWHVGPTGDRRAGDWLDHRVAVWDTHVFAWPGHDLWRPPHQGAAIQLARPRSVLRVNAALCTH